MFKPGWRATPTNFCLNFVPIVSIPWQEIYDYSEGFWNVTWYSHTFGAGRSQGQQLVSTILIPICHGKKPEKIKSHAWVLKKWWSLLRLQWSFWLGNKKHVEMTWNGTQKWCMKLSEAGGVLDVFLLEPSFMSKTRGWQWKKGNLEGILLRVEISGTHTKIKILWIERNGVAVRSWRRFPCAKSIS